MRLRANGRGSLTPQAALLALGCAVTVFASCAHRAQPHPCPPCAPCPACPAIAAPTEQPTGPREWIVNRIKDGDTMVLRQEDPERKETVRLLRINTPEVGEPSHDEAAEALKALVRGGRVTLEFEHPEQEKRDGFGRLLAYVIADGQNVNLEMVRQGWSAFYKKYGKGRLAAEFEAAEQEARAARRGLWYAAPDAASSLAPLEGTPVTVGASGGGNSPLPPVISP